MPNIKSKIAKKITKKITKTAREIKDAILSATGTNKKTIKTTTGAPSKGFVETPGGKPQSNMGYEALSVADNRSQFKGAAKAAAVFGSVAAYDKLTKNEKTKFEKAFSKAHNSGEETFSFGGKSYTTEVKKGTSPKNKNTDKVVPRKKPTPPAKKLMQGGMATKSNKGHMDFRKGGLILSSVDNRKKKK